MGIKYLGMLLLLLPAFMSGASAEMYVENATVFNLSLNITPPELNSSLDGVQPRIFMEYVDTILGTDLNKTSVELDSSLNVVRPRIFTEHLDAIFINNLNATPNVLNSSLAQVRPRIFTEHLDAIFMNNLSATSNVLNSSLAQVRPRIFTENLDYILKYKPIDIAPIFIDLQISGLLPENGSYISSNSVQFSWRTSFNSTTEVYIKSDDEISYTFYAGDNGTFHSVIIDNLTRNKWYNYYVSSGSLTSEQRRFYIDNGVEFSQKSYNFTIERDYSQQVSVSVRNTDSNPHSLLVSVHNPYSDLILGFIGNGSQDQEISLNPGESKYVILSIFAQDAMLSDYNLQITLNSTDSSIYDYAVVNLKVRQPNINYTVTEIAADPYTLTKTFRVNNTGDRITDFSIFAEGDLVNKVLFKPAISHANIGSGESFTFKLVPLLESGTSITGIINATGAGKYKTIAVDFSQSGGKTLFTSVLSNVTICIGTNSWYCTNRPNITNSLYLPSGFDSSDVNAAVLAINFTLPWSGTAYRNHNVNISLNSHPVKSLIGTIPSGLYLIPVDPSYLNYGTTGTGANRIDINTTHLNGGHYIVATNIELRLKLNKLTTKLFADSQEQADTIAKNMDFLCDKCVPKTEISSIEPSPASGQLKVTVNQSAEFNISVKLRNVENGVLQVEVYKGSSLITKSFRDVASVPETIENFTISFQAPDVAGTYGYKILARFREGASGELNGDDICDVRHQITYTINVEKNSFESQIVEPENNVNIAENWVDTQAGSNTVTNTTVKFKGNLSCKDCTPPYHFYWTVDDKSPVHNESNLMIDEFSDYFYNSGNHTVKLVVRDNSGRESSISQKNFEIAVNIAYLPMFFSDGATSEKTKEELQSWAQQVKDYYYKQSYEKENLRNIIIFDSWRPFPKTKEEYYAQNNYCDIKYDYWDSNKRNYCKIIPVIYDLINNDTEINSYIEQKAKNNHLSGGIDNKGFSVFVAITPESSTYNLLPPSWGINPGASGPVAIVNDKNWDFGLHTGYGVWAHELGHAQFGFCDYYDAAKDCGDIGDWGLMGSGDGYYPDVPPSDIISYNKEKAGWLGYEKIYKGDKKQIKLLEEMQPLLDKIPKYDTIRETTCTENYIFEKRRHLKSNGEQGILIYDVDKNDKKLRVIERKQGYTTLYNEKPSLGDPSEGVEFSINNQGELEISDYSPKNTNTVKLCVGDFPTYQNIGIADPNSTSPDVNLYATSNGEIVGLNRTSNNYEMNIPNAEASGNVYGAGSEWITLPNNVNAYYSIDASLAKKWAEENNLTFSSITADLQVIQYDENGTRTESKPMTINISLDNSTVVELPTLLPPVISNIRVSATNDSALITWDTNKEADSRIKYDTSPVNYMFSSHNITLTTNHSFILEGLEPDTQYYFVVNSTDIQGNPNQSIEYSFRTSDIEPPASIENQSVKEIGTTWLNFTWDNPLDPDFSHVMLYLNGSFITNVPTPQNYYNFTGLIPDTPYELGTHTVDTSGNINETWKNATASTLPLSDTTPPTVTDPAASHEIPDDTDNDPLWGETAQLNVIVTDDSGVASVKVNLSEIGGSAAKPMANMGGNIYSTTTNASAGTPPKVYNLTVKATDVFGNSNTSVRIQLRVMKNGDCTGNGVVNIGDALRLANNVSYPGNPAYSLSSPYVCEVTGNGLINIGDALRLANNVSYPGNTAYILK